MIFEKTISANIQYWISSKVLLGLRYSLWLLSSPKETLLISYTNIWSEAYSDPCQISKMELFVNIVNGLKPLTISQKTKS